MIESNCSIHGWTNSRNKTKGLGIFRIPNKNDEYSKHWRNGLVQIFTKHRVVDNQLREHTAKRPSYICELHYREDQINRCKIFIFNFLYLIITIPSNYKDFSLYGSYLKRMFNDFLVPLELLYILINFLRHKLFK